MPSINPVVLVVEDESLVRLLLETDLSEEGFDVVAVGSGAEAIAELDADVERFRAVITDIRLAPGPDGWDVARHARALVPDMPIVYLTGDSTHEWPVKGVPNSVMIGKPFVMAQVITAVTGMMTAVDEQRATASTSAPGDP